MPRRERRSQFLINRPLQFRYMLTLTITLLVIVLIALAGVYFGIWGEVLEAFSDEAIQQDLLTATRLQQYEEARRPVSPEAFSTLSLFKQAERLSERQREVFKEILNRTHRNLWGKLGILLVVIALGSIFLSHKIAGPLYRFESILHQVIQGRLTARCYLRQWDEAKSTGHVLNLALESLDHQISKIKKLVREHEKEREPDPLLPRLKEELSHFETSDDR